MPNGDRKGPMGQGSKTGRAMGYCSGNDSPGCMTETPAGTVRGAGLRAGRGTGRGAGLGAGKRFWRRRTSGFGKGRGFAVQGEYSGYYYPAPAQTRVESNVDFLESRIGSLKQELETLIESFKSLRSQESNEKK